jgi:hypothetical protein
MEVQMPAKRTTKTTKKAAPKRAAKKTTQKTAVKRTKKAAPKKKVAAKAKKGQAYECHVCGLRVVVDEVCGCVEEHALICCSKPMKKKTRKK